MKRSLLNVFLIYVTGLLVSIPSLPVHAQNEELLKQARFTPVDALQSIVPDGFQLIKSTQNPRFDWPGAKGGQTKHLLVQVYENQAGRRALLLSFMEQGRFVPTGWGFVVPCRECGIDLPSSDNVDIQVREGRVLIIDRSFSERDQSRTKATMYWGFDESLRDWRLTKVTQQTEFLSDAMALSSSIDYLTGESTDATLVQDPHHKNWVEQSNTRTSGEPEVISLTDLVLY